MSYRLIFGFHSINSRLRQNAQSIEEIYFDQARQDARMKQTLEKIQAKPIRIIATDSERLNKICSTTQHQGIAAFVKPLPQKDLDNILDECTNPFLLILDGITDPHNLGAILRTADAMGVNAVIAPKDNSVGINATVSKVACGAAETVPYITVTNLSRTMKELKKQNIWILGADMAGESDLFHTDIPTNVAWVMGSEGKGMRRLTRENCDYLVSIPMFGTVESMNVSVSCAMLLAETQRQRCIKK
ncbi:MAG: 23S rRNA (guanosine(2251)-2'-O)-methyltransferase RlmB [Neisseriaceae bacterium]|nr:23S rRNA (guanosine(2251)-2'-O)-methyltransferase RlmB [Neisseriaceae bacterium]